jgi:hypothetical protein
MNFAEQLQAMKACSEALEWVAEKSLEEAWATCERLDWMLWLSARTVDSRLVVSCAAQFARRVAHLNPDPRVVAAIEVAEAFARGEAVDSAMAAADAAWAAAWAAAEAVDVAHDVDVAVSAAWAAAEAVDAAHDAYAARAAAYAADAAYAAEAAEAVDVAYAARAAAYAARAAARAARAAARAAYADDADERAKQCDIIRKAIPLDTIAARISEVGL